MFVFVESIAGREIGRTRPEPDEGHTPAWKSLVAQDAVEEEIYAELRGSRHARGDVERVLAGRPLPVPRHEGGGGVPRDLAHPRRARLHHPEHQRARPLA